MVNQTEQVLIGERRKPLRCTSEGCLVSLLDKARTQTQLQARKWTHPTAATLLPAVLAEGATAEAAAAAAARAAALYIIAALFFCTPPSRSKKHKGAPDPSPTKGSCSSLSPPHD